MLEREAQERDRAAREAGENPAESGWVETEAAEGQARPSQVPDQGGPQGGSELTREYGQ